MNNKRPNPYAQQPAQPAAYPTQPPLPPGPPPPAQPPYDYNAYWAAANAATANPPQPAAAQPVWQPPPEQAAMYANYGYGGGGPPGGYNWAQQRPPQQYAPPAQPPVPVPMPMAPGVPQYAAAPYPPQPAYPVPPQYMPRPPAPPQAPPPPLPQYGPHRPPQTPAAVPQYYPQPQIHQAHHTSPPAKRPRFEGPTHPVPTGPAASQGGQQRFGQNVPSAPRAATSGPPGLQGINQMPLGQRGIGGMADRGGRGGAQAVSKARGGRGRGRGGMMVGRDTGINAVGMAAQRGRGPPRGPSGAFARRGGTFAGTPSGPRSTRTGAQQRDAPTRDGTTTRYGRESSVGLGRGKEEGKRTLTDFRILGFGFDYVLSETTYNWHWGVVRALEKVKKEEEEHRMDVDKDEVKKEETPGTIPTKESSRIRIYFDAPPNANASSLGGPSPARLPGKRKNRDPTPTEGDLEESILEHDESMPPPSIDDAGSRSVDGENATSGDGDDGDWLMAAIGESSEVGSGTAAPSRAASHADAHEEGDQHQQVLEEPDIKKEEIKREDSLFDSKVPPDSSDSSREVDAFLASVTSFATSGGSQVAVSEDAQTATAGLQPSATAATSEGDTTAAKASVESGPGAAQDGTELAPDASSTVDIYASLLPFKPSPPSSTTALPQGSGEHDEESVSSISGPALPLQTSMISTDSTTLDAETDAHHAAHSQATQRLPNPDRLSISYASSTRRLVIDSKVVSHLKIFRKEGRIEVSLRVERLEGSEEVDGITLEAFSEDANSYLPISIPAPPAATSTATAESSVQSSNASASSTSDVKPPIDPTLPVLSLPEPQSLTLIVQLDVENPLSVPKWLKTGDVEDWLQSIFGSSGKNAKQREAEEKDSPGWERKIEVVDPDPPPTIYTVLDSWTLNSAVGTQKDRKQFVESHMDKMDNILEILLRLVRGERATPSAFGQNHPSLTGPLVSAIAPDSAHGHQQTHVSLAVLAMFRLAGEFAERSAPAESDEAQQARAKAREEVENRTKEIIRCLPQHLICKSLDGIYREWFNDRKRKAS